MACAGCRLCLRSSRRAGGERPRHDFICAAKNSLILIVASSRQAILPSARLRYVPRWGLEPWPAFGIDIPTGYARYQSSVVVTMQVALPGDHAAGGITLGEGTGFWRFAK